MIAKIMTILSVPLSLTEIAEKTGANGYDLTVVAKLMRDGKVERIETRKRGGPITFRYRKVTG